MADLYANWAQLAAATVAGVDYQIISQPNSSDMSHLAIHAGGIEAGSGELAKAVGAALGHQIYCMEGIRSSGNTDLHITSTNYDEPQCVAMQNTVNRTVSYHGTSGATAVTHLGGANTAMKNAIGTALTAAGFTVDYTTSEDINGSASTNICNRNLLGAGVQLEMSLALRQSFFPAGDTGGAARRDYSKRTNAFYAYVDALVTAIGPDPKYNTLNTWDGTKWVSITPQTYTGGRWRNNPPLVFDGVQWMEAAPAPRSFPSYSLGSTGIFTPRDYSGAWMPPGVRLNDFIVSAIVTQQGTPTLTKPTSAIPTYYSLSNGMTLAVAVWPWAGVPGDVVWYTRDCGSATSINLVYRYGDVSNTSLTPVTSIQQYANTNQVPLIESTESTSVYLVFTASPTLTGASWPAGVRTRLGQLGTFGTNQISLFSADTPGGGGLLGNLQLDTTVSNAACALITIPGKVGGSPTWILGDSKGSDLGQTTVLE